MIIFSIILQRAASPQVIVQRGDVTPRIWWGFTPGGYSNPSKKSLQCDLSLKFGWFGVYL